MPNVGQLLRELHIPWPAADEAKLREAAAAWHNLAETVRDGYGAANSAAASITSNNAGAAISAFADYWDKYGSRRSGALPRAAAACDAMSSACGQYANAVAETKTKIEEAGAEVAATLVIGTIGALFTFGATEGISDVVAAGLAARVVALIYQLSQAAWEISAAAEEVLSSVLSSAISGALIGTTMPVLTDSADNLVRQAFGDAPVNNESPGTLLAAAGSGAVGGAFGKVADLTRPQLVRLLTNQASAVRETSPQLFVDMMTLAKRLEGMTGKVTAGLAATAASQLVTSQQLQADALSGSALGTLLDRAIEALER